jgi:hypothetical protein
LEGEISDNKLDAPNFGDNSIADLLRKMFLIDSDSSEATEVDSSASYQPTCQQVIKSLSL